MAGLGLRLGLLPGEDYSLLLAGALLSIAVNPLLYRAIDPLETRPTGRRSDPEPAPTAGPCPVAPLAGADSP